MRIVSLLPSATEIICLLGLQDSLVGITHECDYPKTIPDLPIVTTTKISHSLSSKEIDQQVRQALASNNALYSLDYQLLDQLKPDLLVTQSLCNVCAVDKDDVLIAATKLSSDPHVINLEPTSLQDVFSTIEMVAAETNRQQVAMDLIADMKKRVNHVTEYVKSFIEQNDRTRVVYLEWIDPLFNSGHWISELIDLAGGIDCLGRADLPAKTIQWHDVVNADPDVIIIGCCGYDLEKTMLDIPILQSNSGWQDLRCVQSKRVYVIDGNSYFSRPSPRLIESLEILAQILHPQTDVNCDHNYQIIG